MKLCRCGRLIEYNKKYCSECEKKVKKEKSERNRWYDNNVRDSRLTEFYNSHEWEKLREFVIARDNGLCQLSLHNKVIEYGNVCHHIEEVKDCWEKRLDADNVIYVSDSVHNTIHAEYRRSLESKRKMQELLRSLINKK